MAGSLCLALSSMAQAASDIENRIAGLKKDVLDKVSAAAPEKATAQPAKPRRLLVFTNAPGFYHGSIPLAAKAVEIMGKKTGAYETVITDDPAAFDPENLKQYDAIFLDSTTGDMLKPTFREQEEPLRREEEPIRKKEEPLRKEEEALKKQTDAAKKANDEARLTELATKKEELKKKWATLNEELAPRKAELKKKWDALNVELAPKRKEADAKEAVYKKALLDFVNGGKGIAGAHACTDCYYNWREYGEMIGGYFSGHPYYKHIAKLDDPKHPTMAAFEGKPFDYDDEMYVFGPKGKDKEGRENQTYSREKQRVLLSIDVEATKARDTKWNEKAGNRADADYAISWVKKQGDGRIFYCSYGHSDSTWWNKTVLQHFLDGIQFAMGDLKGDITPVPWKPGETPKAEEKK